MKRNLLVLCALFAAAAVRAEAPKAPADSMTGEVAVGETIAIKLDCNPTTGFEWRVKSVNSKVARLEGDIEFRKDASKPGMIGAGGTCVASFKGVKPGKAKVVLEYRRSWEKGPAARTFTAHLKVVAKKQP